jgi:hypothetical protein
MFGRDVRQRNLPTHSERWPEVQQPIRVGSLREVFQTLRSARRAGRRDAQMPPPEHATCGVVGQLRDVAQRRHQPDVIQHTTQTVVDSNTATTAFSLAAYTAACTSCTLRRDQRAVHQRRSNLNGQVQYCVARDVSIHIRSIEVRCGTHSSHGDGHQTTNRRRAHIERYTRRVVVVIICTVAHAHVCSKPSNTLRTDHVESRRKKLLWLERKLDRSLCATSTTARRRTLGRHDCHLVQCQSYKPSWKASTTACPTGR